MNCFILVLDTSGGYNCDKNDLKALFAKFPDPSYISSCYLGTCGSHIKTHFERLQTLGDGLQGNLERI